MDLHLLKAWIVEALKELAVDEASGAGAVVGAQAPLGFEELDKSKRPKKKRRSFSTTNKN